ncbi:unnamed protein product, partial [Mesorhabditis belari]|uniref:Uncharacterized protein n=1 Tax=Mesorhabditis belari TaxID=2138241 RepID=A0AAF3F6Y0_9BILA
MTPPTLAPLYLMKVGEATLCLKNHLVLCGIAKQLRHQLYMAGLSLGEDHYVREFATREQASVFIQNSSAKKSVFVVIDDNIVVNRHAGAEYPQPNILYFTGSFMAKDIVFGVGQQFRSRCDEFAKRLIEEDNLFAVASKDITMRGEGHPACTSVHSKTSKIESGNAYVTSSKTVVSKEEKGFECAACLKGNQICFCLMPIVQLLVEHHPPCVDHELLQLIEEYVDDFIPYQVLKAQMSGEHLEASNESAEDVESAHSSPKEPEPIETSRFNAYTEEPQLERLKLEESLIKSLDIQNLGHLKEDNKQCYDKMPELDEFEDEEITYERDTSSDQSPDENTLPSLTSDPNEQLSPASAETLSISFMNIGSPRVFFTESTKKNTTSSPLSKAESHGSSKSSNKISKALIRTPMMEEEGVDSVPYTSPLHQMPVPLLGTSYQEILMEIEHHNITMSQLRASFAANLSRAHEVISQKLLTDQLYRDITTVNAAIENELKASEALTAVVRPSLNCWVALLVYHSKLTNLLLLAAHSSLELPVTNLVFLRAATKKIVDLNPGQTVKEKLALAIAMLGAAHKKHDLGELIPTFFRDAHKISVYIMVIRLEQVLSRVQADAKAIDISLQDASRLVQTAQETLKALEQNVAEKYAAFFNVVCHILQERWEKISEPFPDFAFTSAIEL